MFMFTSAYDYMHFNVKLLIGQVLNTPMHVHMSTCIFFIQGLLAMQTMPQITFCAKNWPHLILLHQINGMFGVLNSIAESHEKSY